MVDIATRVWNHKWKIDPIVRSLIDTDFYKLLMCQSVLRNKPQTTVVFSLINRSSQVRLADLIDEGELREQLDHIRGLRLTRGESTWLRGNTFYGKRYMFRPDFMEWFEGLRLPPYHLEKRDGQYELTFEGSWPEVMLWEIPALATLMELRGRAMLKKMGRFELEVLYARAKTKLWEKIETLREIDSLRIADFGTRRRHSFLWQDWCVQAMQEGLGEKFVGTSNCLIAMRHGRRNARPDGIAQHGNHHARCGQPHRQQLDPGRHMMRVLHGVMLRQNENRIAPEGGHIVSDKQFITQPARENRPYRQNKQRHCHDQW